MSTILRTPGTETRSAPRPSAERPSAARAWFLAARPHTLPASAAGVIAGIGAAYGAGAAFRPDTAIECLLAALLLQVFANLANDLSDFGRGADTPARLGPPRAVASGWIGPAAMRGGMLLVAAAAGVDGLLLAVAGGPAMLALGIAAVIAALAYTGGPWPFGYKGLGELFVFGFFGPVCVAGTAYLQAGHLEPLQLVASIPAGAFAVAILTTNNLRDIDTDQVAGKRTLAVRFGPGFARAEYVACLVVAWAAVVAVAPGHPLALPTFAVAPAAFPLVRAVYAGGNPRRLNRVLMWTGRVGFAFAILFAAGLAAGGRP